MASRESTAFKERLKSLKNVKHFEECIETLDDKISKTKSQIHNCNNDLNGLFPNNKSIKYKLKILKEQLVKLENERDNS